MKLLVILFLVNQLAGNLVKEYCPPKELLSSFNCSCRLIVWNAYVNCQNVGGVENLQNVVEALAEFDFTGLTLSNLNISYFPVDTSDQLYMKRLTIFRSTIKRLTRPEDGDRLFKHSKLKGIRFSYSDIEDNDLTSLGNIPNLEELEVIGYPREIDVLSLAKRLPSASLTELNLSAKKLHWAPGAARMLKQAEGLRFANADVGEIRREDFPEHASNLTFLRLENFSLQNIPDDLFSGMTKLNYIDLSSNRLTTLNEATFVNFTSTLVLDDNPLECDSRLDWLVYRLREGSIELMSTDSARCSDGRLFFPDGEK